MREPKNKQDRKTLLVALTASYIQEMAEINDYAPNVEDIYYSEHLGSWIITFENGDDQEFETKEEAIAWIKAESTS